MSAPKDWLKWTAAGFALIATASAEYELARAIGMHPWIAAAVPGALDAYVVRALRAHREVLTAVLAMVAVNAASHLVTASVLSMGWPLITAVSAIAPLVLWRVHALGTPGEARKHVLWTGRLPKHTPEHTGTVNVPEAQMCSNCGTALAWFEHETDPGWVHAPGNDTRCITPEHASTVSVPASEERFDTATGEYYNVPASTDTFDEHVNDVPGMLDYVPAQWSRPPATDTVAGTPPDARHTDAHATVPAIKYPCSCACPADEHSVYGCSDGCGCEHMCGPSCSSHGRAGTPCTNPEHDDCVGYPRCRGEHATVPETQYPCAECEHVIGTHNEHGCYSLLCPCTVRRSTLVETEHDERDEARVLALVPPLPPGYVLAELTPGDMEHMERARVLDRMTRAGTGKGPGVRALKRELGTGTERAQRIKHALDAEHTARTDGGTP